MSGKKVLRPITAQFHGHVQDVVVEGVVEAVTGDAVAGSRMPATSTCGTDIVSGGSRPHWISADTLIGSRRRTRKNWSV